MSQDKALQIIMVVAETVRELKEVPSGHLYARLMAHMDLHQYNQIIGILKKTHLVEEKANVLRWIGPENSNSG